MTVGIAAIAQGASSQEIIVAADRLVTVGRRGGVEYEDTSSKIEVIDQRNGLSLVAVGSGRTTLIDEIMDTARDYMDQVGEIENARSAANILNQAYQHVVRQTVENTVLQPLGYTLQDLRDSDVDIPGHMQQSIMQATQEKRQAMRDNVQLIAAAVDQESAEIQMLAGGDFSNFTDTGYVVIGSGSDSARLTFIRRRYDPNDSTREGVFTVLEAKDQAEERQGVGQRMDIIKVGPGSVYEFSGEDKELLRDKLYEIGKREQKARTSVMEDWPAPYE